MAANMLTHYDDAIVCEVCKYAHDVAPKPKPPYPMPPRRIDSLQSHEAKGHAGSYGACDICQ